MSTADTGRALGANRLLNALLLEERDQLMRQMERVSLDFKQVIYEPNERIQYVYFPINAVISLLVLMEDGRLVEFGSVGKEGMAGLPVFLGAPVSTSQSFAQIPGAALRMTTEVFTDVVLGRGGALHRLLHRYTQAFLVQTAQGLACNSLHSIEQRFCRWMLMTQDRVGRDSFPLTQEFIAQMLGVRRASVSVVASTIQKDGLIAYHRGTMNILDRPGLKRQAVSVIVSFRARTSGCFVKPVCLKGGLESGLSRCGCGSVHHPNLSSLSPHDIPPFL